MGQDNSKRKSASGRRASVTGKPTIGFHPPHAEPAQPSPASGSGIWEDNRNESEAALGPKGPERAMPGLPQVNDNGADVDPQVDPSASMLSHQQVNQLSSGDSQANDTQELKNKGEVCQDLDHKLLKKLSWWRWLLSAVTWRLAFWLRERPKTLEADNEVEAKERIERFKAHLYWAPIPSPSKETVRSLLCLMNTQTPLKHVESKTVRTCESTLRLPHDDQTQLIPSPERIKNGPNGMR